MGISVRDYLDCWLRWKDPAHCGQCNSLGLASKHHACVCLFLLLAVDVQVPALMFCTSHLGL